MLPATQRVNLKIVGSESHGIPLRDLAGIIGGWSNTLDTSYRSLTRSKRIDSIGRQQFDVRATEVRNGSIEIIMDIVSNPEQITWAALAATNPTAIWQNAKDAIEFFNIWFQKIKSGVQPVISVKGDRNTVVAGNLSVQGDLIILSGDTFDTALAARPTLQRMSKAISDKRIKSWSISSEDQTAMTIGPEQASIFDVQFQTDNDPIVLTGSVIKANKLSESGQIRVYRSDHITSGSDINFRLKNRKTKQLFAAFPEDLVEIQAIPETIEDYDGTRRIVYLHVLTIRPIPILLDPKPLTKPRKKRRR